MASLTSYQDHQGPPHKGTPAPVFRGNHLIENAAKPQQSEYSFEQIDPTPPMSTHYGPLHCWVDPIGCQGNLKCRASAAL